MRIYIVRHGKAFDTASLPPRGSAAAMDPDFARELTPRGEAQARFLASRLLGSERRVKTIVASRYPRALQTATGIRASLNCDLATDVRLEVNHEVSEALEVIAEHAHDRAVMLVGHNPQLGELISVLCSGLAPADLILKTGEMVVIDARSGGLVGSGRIIERVRMTDDGPADDTTAGTPIEPTGASRRP
jgi:phosphohistidine phosphatase SixA